MQTWAANPQADGFTYASNIILGAGLGAACPTIAIGGLVGTAIAGTTAATVGADVGYWMQVGNLAGGLYGGVGTAFAYGGARAAATNLAFLGLSATAGAGIDLAMGGNGLFGANLGMMAGGVAYAGAMTYNTRHAAMLARPRTARPMPEDLAEFLSPAPGRIARVGTYRENVSEIPIEDLNPIHPVPRKGMPIDYIENLAAKIEANGFDLSRPVSATRLPDGTLVVTGGHHRIAAMQILGESTVPVRVFDYATTDPVKLGQWLGIGQITGKYSGSYCPDLTPAQQQVVNEYLQAWRQANGF